MVDMNKKHTNKKNGFRISQMVVQNRHLTHFYRTEHDIDLFQMINMFLTKELNRFLARSHQETETGGVFCSQIKLETNIKCMSMGLCLCFEEVKLCFIVCRNEESKNVFNTKILWRHTRENTKFM